MGALLSLMAQSVAFGRVAQAVSGRIRVQLFGAILRQEVGSHAALDLDLWSCSALQDTIWPSMLTAALNPPWHQRLAILPPSTFIYLNMTITPNAPCQPTQPQVGWFDESDHSSGKLTANLATDATYVRGAVGDVFGVAFQNLTTLVLGYFVALAFDWRMALVITGG